MKKIFLLCLLLSALLTGSIVYGQRKVADAPFGNVEGVTAAEMKDYLYFVASDEMEGRDTPSRGLNTTAKFLALNLSRWGLKPAGNGEGHLDRYFQKIALASRSLQPEGTAFSFGGQEYKIGEDFLAAPVAGKASGALVFVDHGYMIKSKSIDPYQGVDAKGKILVVAEGMPRGTSFQNLRGKVGVDYDTPESYARAHNAAGIIVVAGSSTLNFWPQRYQSSLTPSRPRMENPQAAGGVPTVVVSEKLAAALFAGESLDYEAIKKQVGEGTAIAPFALNASKAASFNVNAKNNGLMTQNVVAILEGSDPNLKNEYVAIGAHYDHVGMRPNGEGDRIFNGADDDGSGTVAVLTLAHALATGVRPKRSILFVWHAGEEKGLWGSEYIADNPPVPIDQIVTQLNIDMIGRTKGADDKNPRNVNLTGPDEIYVIGSKMMSTELGELSEATNKALYNVKFNYKYDDPNDTERLFYRSDHYNYAKKGIPIIFYFDGVHEDYHGVGDSPDKIDYAKMEKVTRTVLATAWKLANAPARVKVDKPLPAQLSGD